MHLLNTLLNPFYIRKSILVLINTAFIFTALFITLNCGNRKPPLPPIERVAQRVEISGIQRGSQIIISWVMPPRNADEGNILNIQRADIYRLVEKQDDSVSLSEEEFVSNSTLIANVPISEADFGMKKLSYSDTLEFSGQPVRLRYAIRFVNASGQKAAFSNFFIVEPTSRIASSPNSLSVEVEEQSINLKWTSPLSNVDNSTPVNLLGFNIYRLSGISDEQKLLNNTPFTGNTFSDKSFEFEKKYSYFVRAVSLGANGVPVESLESNLVVVVPKDIFAPGAPTAITIAASPGSLSIFFAVNPEKDIAGYQVYRSQDKNLALNEWNTLTPDLLKTNTFLDKSVESGKTYYYYLKAVDFAGNISQPSEIVSETVP